MGNGSASARSVWIKFTNDTSYTITETAYHLHHGSWTSSSPSEIAPHSSATWQSESSGIMTGTEGYTKYTIDGKPFTLRWNNPYAGSNGYDYDNPTGFSISYHGGSGDNADVYFTIKKNAPTIDQMPTIPPRLLNAYLSLCYVIDNNLTTKINALDLLDDEKDESNFSLNRADISKTSLESSSSIILNYKNNYEDYTVIFGTKGSTVHVGISLITYKNKYGRSSTYHFGLLLSGNSYTVINNKTKTKSVKNYMMIHLLHDSIEFMLCKTRERAMCALSKVWHTNDPKAEISHYQRDIGHSILSARIICRYLIKEQNDNKIPYEFKKLKEHHEHLTVWYPKKDLACITNCFLFVIRFAKLLNQANTKIIKIPTAQQIVDWTIGKQDWLKIDRFKNIWDHSKKATPF